MEQDSSHSEFIPWSQRTPRLVSHPALGQNLHSASLSSRFSTDLKLPFPGVKFFRGAPTGNRLDLAADQMFIADTGVDFRLTGWTGGHHRIYNAHIMALKLPAARSTALTVVDYKTLITCFNPTAKHLSLGRVDQGRGVRVAARALQLQVGVPPPGLLWIGPIEAA